MSTRQNFTTPVGRLVMGSLYKPQTTDAENRPLVVKSGPNAGQPRQDYFFAVAIPKGPEPHWAHTEWGQKIWNAGHTGFPQGQANAPTFAWKVVDGDSQTPNRKGHKPCDREGYPGNWVISFSSGFAPKIYNKDGSAPIVEPNAVKLGYYVQVNGDVVDNGSLQQPGVFINHNMVALAAFGEEISVGPDASAVGFGNGPLPAGAKAMPAGAFTPPVTPGAPATPGAVPPPGAPAAPAAPGAPAGYVPPPGAAAAPVMPNPAFLGAPPAAPVAPKRTMTALAQGATYEAMIAAGWNDALLLQHGMMVQA